VLRENSRQQYTTTHTTATMVHTTHPPHTDGTDHTNRISTSRSGHGSETSTAATAATSCAQCVQMLQEALARSDSKPARLLRSIQQGGSCVSDDNTGSSSTVEEEKKNGASLSSTGTRSTGMRWRKIQNGVQVEIPVEMQQPSFVTSDNADLDDAERGVSLLRQLTRRFPQQPQKHLQRRMSAQLATSSRVDGTDPPNLTPFNNSAPAGKEWISMICRHCSDTGPEAKARAFVLGPQPLSVVVCQNRLLHTVAPTATDSNATTSATAQQRQRDEMDEILTHELVHVYDVRVLAKDLLQCHNLAYSEVRAAREAECSRFLKSTTTTTTTTATAGGWFPGNLLASASSNSNHTSYWNRISHQHCVRDKAMASTRNLFPADAKSCIDAVFERAFADERPFSVPTPLHAAKNNNTSHTSSSSQGSTAQQPPAVPTDVTTGTSPDVTINKKETKHMAHLTKNTARNGSSSSSEEETLMAPQFRQQPTSQR
jgi:Peptidase M76 family